MGNRQVLTLFFFNDTATTEIYTLSLHDALPIYGRSLQSTAGQVTSGGGRWALGDTARLRTTLHVTGLGSSSQGPAGSASRGRSEEHTSELQSRQYLVCRLLLEKKKKIHNFLLLQ